MACLSVNAPGPVTSRHRDGAEGRRAGRHGGGRPRRPAPRVEGGGACERNGDSPVQRPCSRGSVGLLLRRDLPDIDPHRQEGGERRRVHDRRQQHRFRNLRGQHDGDLDLGVLDVRVGDVRLHLRHLRPHPLRALGRPDDPLHLPLREADPCRRAEGAHARRGHVRPARALQPVDAGRLEHRRQPDQPDVELHRRWRADLAAVAVHVHPGRLRRRRRRPALHAVVRLPRLRAHRLRAGRGDARRGGRHHPGHLLRRRLPGRLRVRRGQPDRAAGRLLLQHGLHGTGRPVHRGGARLRDRQPDHRAAAVRGEGEPDQAHLHHRDRRLRRDGHRCRHARCARPLPRPRARRRRPEQHHPGHGGRVPAARAAGPLLRHDRRRALLDGRLGPRRPLLDHDGRRVRPERGREGEGRPEDHAARGPHHDGGGDRGGRGLRQPATEHPRPAGVRRRAVGRPRLPRPGQFLLGQGHRKGVHHLGARGARRVPAGPLLLDPGGRLLRHRRGRAGGRRCRRRARPDGLRLPRRPRRKDRRCGRGRGDRAVRRRLPARVRHAVRLAGRLLGVHRHLLGHVRAPERGLRLRRHRAPHR